MPLQTEEWARKDVAFLSRQLPLPRYRRLLDLCCGPGRHALRLARQGYGVTALDRDEAVIVEARDLAVDAKQEIAYIVGDMRRIDALAGEFDAVINMWQSFGYFDDETNRNVLRHVHHKLTPGGRFILDMYNRDYFERHHGHQETGQREINGVIVESTGYMQGNRWHAVLAYKDEQGKCGSDHFEWQVFTPDEFLALASECGFASLLVCTQSDETISPSPAIPRMEIVLEKQ